MSFKTDWDIDKYREEHESNEHWSLRKQFMERWKSDYSEERLVCLARVFANMELLGCRYPTEVMQEVARLSQELSQSYRNSRKNKLQRTFVSASDAAEDRAKGIKREGSIIVGKPLAKTPKINFVPQGFVSQSEEDLNLIHSKDTELKVNKITECKTSEKEKISEKKSDTVDVNDYMDEMSNIPCLDVRDFNESMFETHFGRLVLLIRPWAPRLGNIQDMCRACNVFNENKYEDGCFSIYINDQLVAKASGISKAEARVVAETMAWKRLREEVISVVVKEQWIAHGQSRISVNDVSVNGREFGTPVETSVATKMMQLMGWKGGGLGADSQGIAEPIKPNLQMVNRAGLGSNTSDLNHLRRAGNELMRRFIASDTLDVDLVFTSEFSKEERALLHKCAQRAHLASKSYGTVDRFLVVKKKLDPFAIARAVIEKGGNTPKYQIFIPMALSRHRRR